LAKLLPKTSELKTPPILKYAYEEDYKVYCQAICSFIMQTTEATNIASEDIVKIGEKLAPFVVYRLEQTL